MARLAPIRTLTAACAAAAALAAAMASPAAAAPPVVGISDQSAATFSHPEFTALGRRHARLVTPWNSITEEPGRLDAWLQAARASGMEPFVTFERARDQNCPFDPCEPPTAAWYEVMVDLWRERYPWVTVFAPWNEANHSSQPTAATPELAASYYKILRDRCAGCTVLGADLIEASNLSSWVGRFKAAVDSVPQLWGFHNYSDVNRFRSSGTDAFLAMVPGQVWLTETGGIVWFKTVNGVTTFPYDERRAAEAIGYLFRLARPRVARIPRVYVYQWMKNNVPTDRFDAGLVGLDARPRPALGVLRYELRISSALPPDPDGGVIGDAVNVHTGSPADGHAGDGPAGGEDGLGVLPGRAEGGSPRVRRPVRAGRALLGRDGVLRVSVRCRAAPPCRLRVRVVTLDPVGSRRFGKPQRRILLAQRSLRLRSAAAWVRLRVSPRMLRLVDRVSPSGGMALRVTTTTAGTVPATRVVVLSRRAA